MNTATPGASSLQQRTFDCPWCGAISPVPTDHMGEHFECPECKKRTKLTEKNTFAGRPTAPPPDAPHLSGDRTFDCPWCGAISAVPSSFLGERYTCDECHRETKLTSTNTRRAPITAPPPDAPPPEAAAPRTGVYLVGGLIVGAAIVFAVATSGTEDKVPAAAKPAAGKPAASKPAGEVAVKPGPKAGPQAGPKVATPPGPDMAEPPLPDTPPVPPTPEATPPAPPARPEGELRLAMAEFVRATEEASAAETALTALRAKLDAWAQANPEAVAAGARLDALREVAGEAKRLLAATPDLSDPAKATPEQARAFDAAMVAFVGAKPARVGVVEDVLARIRAGFLGRSVGADWKALDFHGPAFSREAAALEEAYGTAAAGRPADLAKAVDEAAGRLAAARVAKAAAEARLQWPTEKDGK